MELLSISIATNQTWMKNTDLSHKKENMQMSIAIVKNLKTFVIYEVEK
jgi:hypothetical protein